jgi:hypothetical protein
MVAATLARESGIRSLALWEPLTDPARYYRDAFRARMIPEVREPAAEPRSLERLLEELEATGAADILGYVVGGPLYRTSKGRTLAAEIGDALGARLLVIHPITRNALGEDYREFVETLKARGFSVEAAAIGEAMPIWFHGPWVGQADALAEEVASRLLAWLVPQAAS